jgi:hypothetical protein
VPTPRQPRPAVGKTPPSLPEDTRMARDRMAAENRAEQQEAGKRMALISAQGSADDQDGVFDGQSGDLLDAGMTPDQEAALGRQLQIGDPDEVIEDAHFQGAPAYTPEDGERVGANGVPIVEAGAEEDPDVVHAVRPTGGLRPDMVAPEEVPDVARVGAGQTDTRIVRHKQAERQRVVRVNASIQPTIGQGPGNTWDFQEGRKYRVPESVANHLAEKGYVSQWG